MNTERKLLRENVLGVVGDAAQNCPLPTTNILVLPKRVSIEELLERIVAGSFYEINHSKLPSDCPDVLHTLRAVMVTAKTEQYVTIRYPSSRSLQAFFTKTDRQALMEKLYPGTDEKYDMVPMLAVEVLGQQIPSLEFVERKHSKSFWLIDNYNTEVRSLPASISGGAASANDPKSKHGACFSSLASCPIKGWGSRNVQPIVSYVPVKQLDDADEAVSGSRHVQPIFSYVPVKQLDDADEAVGTLSLGDHKESSKEEQSQETKEQSQETKEHSQEHKVQTIIQYSRKRKRGRPVRSQSKKRKLSKRKPLKVKPKVQENTKREPLEIKPKIEGNTVEKQVELKPTFERQLRERKPNQLSKVKSKKLKGKSKKLKVKSNKLKVESNNGAERVDRWSAVRYEVAVKELVEVLKASNAIFGNPITRYKLRAEARKRIGDTGLLDHLLKHLAGKVVPTGGIDRLRRRCDAEGKMEYWLESSDLINIRKEFGVKNPYWTPPPGWKPGDCLSSNSCICCKEAMLLKDELDNLRRQITELKFKDENQQAVSALPIESATSSGRLDNANWSVNNSKDSYELLIKKKTVLEEQLLKMSQALVELEEDMKNLPSKIAAEGNRSSLILSYSNGSPVAQINEMMRTNSDDLLKETSEESSESDEESDDGSDYEVEREGQATKRLTMVRLKQCSHREDLIAITTPSASPHSTTTS